MEPIELYASIQPMVQKEIETKIALFSKEEKFDLADVPFHRHTGSDSSRVDFSDLENKTRFVICRIVAAITDTTVANVVGGDFVMPFPGYITGVGATVDTAGTTNLTTIDINKNGASIMLTKVTIDSTEKTSRTGAAAAVLDTSAITFLTGDIFTFDVDAIQTTAAKGLTMFINVVET